MLACAAAKECGLNVLVVKGAELLNKYIGASEEGPTFSLSSYPEIYKYYRIEITDHIISI